MDVVCNIECDNCGTIKITNPKIVTFFIIDDIIGVTVCPKCKIPMFINMGVEEVINIAKKGVKIFSFETGEEVSADTLS